MLTALRVQLKNVIRDKFVQISILLPIVLVIGLKLYTPNLIIEPQVAILKGNISQTLINQLESVAVVEQYSQITQLRSRVLESKNEIIGIIFDENKGNFKFILEGNETTRVKANLQVIAGLLDGKLINDKIQTEILDNESNDLYYFLITLVLLIALFMGCTFNAFNIVTEKEEGITNINKILPIQKTDYILQKTILGFIGSVVLTAVTLSIAVGSQIDNWWLVFLFILVSSFAVSILGLYLGFISNGLISIIINTKVILLLFMFIPVIGFIMPADLEIVKNVFYLVPSYPMFQGLWVILKDGNIIKILFNTGVVAVHALLAYLIYLNFLKKV